MSRYQDYVIKDGKLVGKFEEMYQKFSDPWLQSQSENNQLSPSRNSALLAIQKYGIKSVVEMGCGLGYFTKLIKERTSAKVLGVDISKTAIEQAKKKVPGVDFQVGTIRQLKEYKGHDAILFAEITWYILDDLKQAFQDMLEAFPGKYFIHNLVFYKGDSQKYGRDFFSNMDEFVKFCPFKLLEWSMSSTNDPNSTISTSQVFRIEPK